nr:sugar phosphate isomerase/epimerase and 4-hydroxyphenylpyruvate domain-containing protein [Brevibacterium sp. XM4083]
MSGTLEEKLRAASRAGFDGVEIFEQDLVVSPLSPEAVRELAGDLGISLDLYQPFRDFEGVDEEQFAANLDRAHAKFTLMRRLGIGTMLLCSNVGTATISDDTVAAGHLRRLGDLAAQFDIDVAYEALAWGRFVSEYDHAWQIVERTDHPHIGTCLDSFHILSRGTDLDLISEIPGEKIFFLQLADAPALTMDVLSWSRHHRVFPGEGAWNLPDFLARVVDSGYRGPVSLEVFNDSFRQSDTDRTAVDGLRSLRWLEATTADIRAATFAPARGAETVEEQYRPKDADCSRDRRRIERIDLRQLPDVAEPHGVDFAEISTTDLGAVARQLHQLDFRFTGYHRSKPHIQLWQRGSARIIVSEIDRSSTGQAPTFLRGIGFSVSDSEAAMHRAALLLAAEVPRKQTHDDAVLRGVYAPDGSEVFFQTDRGHTPGWTAEFGTLLDDRRSAIDHINLSQPAQHFDEAVLFYSSLLDLRAQTAQEVPSPTGLVRSQVMSSADGSVRLPLNVAPQATTGSKLGDLSPTVTAQHPEHIAITCDDIFDAASTARARGLDFLVIPDNYYDDLDARFDLPADLLARLRDHHVLYDRDAHGEFLHFYTSTTGAVFFEMVQRTGAYSGFGAPNAPVRLAAQHRLSSHF